MNTVFHLRCHKWTLSFIQVSVFTPGQVVALPSSDPSSNEKWIFQTGYDVGPFNLYNMTLNQHEQPAHIRTMSMCCWEVNIPLFNLCFKYLFSPLSPFAHRIIIGLIYWGANILIPSEFFNEPLHWPLLSFLAIINIHASFVLVGHKMIYFPLLSLKHRNNTFKIINRKIKEYK